MINDFFEGQVELIDSAEEMALEAKALLSKWGLIGNNLNHPEHHFFVSDLPDRFVELAERFLGRSIEKVELVNLED